MIISKSYMKYLCKYVCNSDPQAIAILEEQLARIEKKVLKLQNDLSERTQNNEKK